MGKQFVCKAGTVLRDPNQICLPKLMISAGPSTATDCDQLQCCMTPPSRLYEPRHAMEGGNRQKSHYIRGPLPQPRVLQTFPMRLVLGCAVLGAMSCVFVVISRLLVRRHKSQTSFRRVLAVDASEVLAVA